MKMLLIKTSSLGDILHTFPAITDAMKQFPDIEITWVVEEVFASIANWHPAIKKVLPIALRRWRKNFWANKSEIKGFLKTLKTDKYDYIIDAQGLIKSALISRVAKGARYGLNYHSARESLASFFYQTKIAVDKNQHAILRTRQLFSKILAYGFDPDQIDYGIQIKENLVNWQPGNHYLIFLHATTWQTKLYPEAYWRQLIQAATEKGYTVLLPWGNSDEKVRSERLAKGFSKAIIPPKLSLLDLANLFKKATGVIAVDTGLGHLAAALSIPTVSLYGSTNPERTGTLGKNQIHLAAQFECAPCLQKKCTYKEKKEVFPACFMTIPPEKVWAEFLVIASAAKQSSFK
jgi:heptosyltransferase-1